MLDSIVEIWRRVTIPGSMIVTDERCCICDKGDLRFNDHLAPFAKLLKATITTLGEIKKFIEI